MRLSSRSLTLFSLALLLVAAGCYSPDIPDGQLACTADSKCPEGYVCSPSKHCFKEGVTVPGAPTEVTATAGVRSATVRWTAPVSDGGAKITGYIVSVTPRGNYSIAFGSDGVSATVAGLANATSYTFTVHATNGAGDSAESAPSSAVTTLGLPGAPTGVSGAASLLSVQLSWTAPADSGGSPITGYLITPSIGLTLTSIGTATSTTVLNLSSTSTYTFTVAAITAVGTGPASDPSAGVTPLPTATVPGAPTGVTATATGLTASVSWTAPASDGGAAITGYTVFQAVNGADFAQAAVTTSTSAIVSGFSPGDSVVFEVFARNPVGNSASSDPSAALVFGDLPAAPVITSASPVTVDSTGLTASVPADSGATYTWSIAGGVITSAGGESGVTAGGTNSITFTATAATGGQIVLTCAATTDIGTGLAGTRSIDVVALPVQPIVSAPAALTTLHSGSANVTANPGMTYQWSVTGATITSTGGPSGVTAGGTNSITFTDTAAAGGTISYSVVEINAALTASAAGTAQTNVVAAPVTPVVTAPANVNAGSAGVTASVVAHAGMTYLWTITGGTFGAGGSGGVTATGTNTVTFNVTGAGGTDLTLGCVEINAASTQSSSGSAATHILSLPSQPSITAPLHANTGTLVSASVTAHTGMHYAWTVSNATFDVNGSGGVTNGTTNTVGFTITGGAGATVVLTATELNALGAASTAASVNIIVDAGIGVSSVTPAGTNVALNSPIVVTFNRAADPNSVTINNGAAACTGSILISTTSTFASCVALQSVSGTSTVYTINAGTLAPATSYFVRATTAITDSSGTAMTAAFTTGTPFTTKAAFTITATAPGGTGVSVASAVSVTFSRAAATSSITTSASGTSCTGALQLSSDDFASCVALGSATAAASNGNTTFSATPAAPLAYGTSYKLRVTTAALDSDGVPLAATFTSSAFTTAQALTLLTLATSSGTASNVPLNAHVLAHFDNAFDAASATSDASCTGSVRVSKDAFATCAAVTFNAVGGDLEIIPVSPLDGGATYEVALTSGLTANGVALSNPTVTPFSFSTKAALTATFSPASSPDAPINSAIVITFNRPVQPFGYDASCTGAAALSVTAGARCEPMNESSPIDSPDFMTFTIHPVLLQPDSAYTIALSTLLQDADGANLPAPLSGTFTTKSAFSVTSATPSGTGAARNGAISLTFNRPPANVTLGDSSCNGRLRLSTSPTFTAGSCVALSGLSVVGNTASATAPVLLPDTTYYIGGTADLADSDGVTLGTAFSTSATTRSAIVVTAVTPADGDTPTVSTAISVTFNTAALASSITGNTGADTTCSGSVQVSSDNFATCVPMTGAAQTGDDLTFTLTPAAALAESTTYKVRVTTAAKDASGLALASAFTQPVGFTTLAGFAVSSTSPADGATSTPRGTAITVTFNHPAQANTITTGQTTACGSDTVQVSADDFATCVPLSSTVTASGDLLRFTVQPSAHLAADTRYKVRVTTGATDTLGRRLGAQYTSSTGFTTVTALGVLAYTPANGATNVGVDSAIQVKFDRAVQPATISVGTDTTCNGSLVLSSSPGFSDGTCVALDANSLTGATDTYTVQPVSSLAYGITYYIRVTTAVLDLAGETAAGDLDSTGFTTLQPFVVLTSTPQDAATIARAGTISVTFNHAPAAASLTTNTADTSCSGTFQLSTDDTFTSCLQMDASGVTASGGDYTVKPAALLDADSTYSFRVLGAQDAFGVTASTFLIHLHTPPPLAIDASTLSPADGVTVPRSPASFSFAFVDNGVSPDLATLTVNTGSDTTCSGNLRFSADGFTTCIPMTAATNTGGTFTLNPASGAWPAGVTIVFALTSSVTDTDGNPATSYMSLGFSTSEVLRVVGTTPVTVGNPLDTRPTVTFNRPITVGPALTFSTDGSCTGSFQLKKLPDGPCVPLTGIDTSDFTTVVLGVGALLDPGSSYVTIVTDVVDTDGLGLDGSYTSLPFSTYTLPTVASTSPADSLTPTVSQNTPITITFSEAMDPDSLSTNLTGSTACGGSVGISSSDFSDCVPIGNVTFSSDFTSMTLQPDALLPLSTTFQIRVTTAAKSAQGAPLASTYLSTNGFRVLDGVSVVSITPADGSTITRGQVFTVTFNKAINPGTLVSSGANCQNGTATLTTEPHFGSCAPLTISTLDNVTFTFTPTVRLPANTFTIFELTDLAGADGAPFEGFDGRYTTVPAFTVVSSVPADGDSNVAVTGATFSVTFSAPPDAASIGLDDGSCTGHITLGTGGACVALTSTGVSGNTVSFTADTFANDSLYTLSVNGVTNDTDALAQAYSAAFTTEQGLGEVSDLTVDESLQTASLSWTPPTSSAYVAANVYTRSAGSSGVWVPAGTGVSGFDLTMNGRGGLAWNDNVDVLVRSFDDSSHESTGVELDNVALKLSGRAKDFLQPLALDETTQASGQVGRGLSGNHFALTWTTDQLFAGVSDPDGNTLLQNGDALWIALDTNPEGGDLSLDPRGEQASIVSNPNDVIWPFKADYVIKVLAVDAETVTVTLRDVNAATEQDLGSQALSVRGGVTEVNVPKSLFGDVGTALNVAMAVVTSGNVTTDLFPRGAGFNVDTTGAFTSFSTALVQPSTAFTEASRTTSLESATLTPAPFLVDFTLAGTVADGDVHLTGSLHPLAANDTDSIFKLVRPDVSAPYTARAKLNFGGQNGNLQFRFSDSVGSEFINNVHRIRSLDGHADALPALTFGEVWDATHSFQLEFDVTNPDGVTDPITEIRGNVSELGFFGPGVNTSGSGPFTATVSFAPADFTASDLQFGAFSATLGNGDRHYFGDDVIEHATLAWTALDPTFPQSRHAQVVSTNPADGQLGIPSDQGVVFNFNAPIDPTSLTLNSDTTCSGAVQLSADGFATCVPLQGAFATQSDPASYSIQPADPLAHATRYFLRIAAPAQTSGGAVPVTYTMRTGFRTADAVLSSTPAPAATNVARDMDLTFVFAAPIDAASATVSSDGDCAHGTIYISPTSDFTSCFPATVTVSGSTLTLHGIWPAGQVVAYISQGVTEQGVPVEPYYDAFTTHSIGVYSSVPASNQVVSVDGDHSQYQVTFNDDPDAVTVDTAGDCSGNITLQGPSGCLPLALTDVTANVAHFHPVGFLVASANFTLSVQGVTFGGLPQDSVYTVTFHTEGPPAEVSGINVTPYLQSIVVSWTPSGGTYDHAVVSWSEHGAATFVSPVSGTNQVTLTNLSAPFTNYDLRVAASDAGGNLSSGVVVQNVQTAFTGTAQDWFQPLPLDGSTPRSGQAGLGLRGNKFRYASNQSDLFVGLSTNGDGRALNPGDALWIGLDTNAEGDDTTGEGRTTVIGVNDIIWPFNADYVVELKVISAGNTQVNLRNAAGNTWAPLTTETYDGAVEEIRIPRAALGSTGKHLQLAMVALTSSNGHSFDLYPRGNNQDTTGYFTSFTAGADYQAFSPFPGTDSGSIETQSSLADAQTLVAFDVTGIPAGTDTVKLKGSLHPFSYTLTDSDYALVPGAAPGEFTGAFNLGGVTDDLYFRFDAAQGGVSQTEFTSGQDRVRLLKATDVLPPLTFGQSYSASHAPELIFDLFSGGSPTEVRGNISELGNFNTTSGALLTAVPGDTDHWAASIQLDSGYDFMATPLHFKAWYGSGYEGGSDHIVNDDIIDTIKLTWHAGDGT
ncbi:MAG: Ig-like domain-containing protein [Deltaproteobacteria bacterium]|nr:Ig-like domain-containing protein [Deltaproteobacteria bacterium]